MSNKGLPQITFSSDIEGNDYRTKCECRAKRYKWLCNNDEKIEECFSYMQSYQNIDNGIKYMFSEIVSEEKSKELHKAIGRVDVETFICCYKFIGLFGVKAMTKLLKRETKQIESIAK